MSVNPQARTSSTVVHHHHHRRHPSPHPPQHFLRHSHGRHVPPPIGARRTRAYSFPGSDLGDFDRGAFLESLRRDLKHMHSDASIRARGLHHMSSRGGGRINPPFEPHARHRPSHHHHVFARPGCNHFFKGHGHPFDDIHTSRQLPPRPHDRRYCEKAFSPSLSSETESEEGETVLLSRSPSFVEEQPTMTPRMAPFRQDFRPHEPSRSGSPPMHHGHMFHRHLRHHGHTKHEDHRLMSPPPPPMSQHLPHPHRGAMRCGGLHDHNRHHHLHHAPKHAHTAPSFLDRPGAGPLLKGHPHQRPRFGRCAVHRGRSGHERSLPFMANVYV